MYRIKLASGEELEFDSSEALADGVRAGTVTDDAAIFHARSGRWLPVHLHPHYRIAKARAASPRTGGPAAPGPKPAPAPQSGTARPAASEQAAPRRQLRLTRPGTASSQAPAPLPLSRQAPRPLAAAPSLDFLQLEPQFDEDDTAPADPAADDPMASAGPDLPIIEIEPEPAEPAEPIAAEQPPAASVPPVRAPATGMSAREPEPIELPPPELKFIEVEPAPRPLRSYLTETLPEPSAPAPERRSTDRRESDRRESARNEPNHRETPQRTPAPREPRSQSARAESLQPMAEPLSAVLTHELPQPERAPEPDTRRTRDARPKVTLAPERHGHEAVHPADRAPRSGGRGVMLVTGIVVLALGVTAAVWQPWSHRAKPSDPGQVVISETMSATAAAPAPAVAKAPDVPPAGLPVAPSDRKAAAPTGAPMPPVRPDSAAALRKQRTDTASPTLDLPERPGALAIAAPDDLPSVGTTSPAGAALPISPAELGRRYTAAYAAARSELDARLTAAGFSHLLTTERIADPEGIAAGRRSVTAAVAALKQFRARESAIEQGYQDTLALVGRKLSLGGDELKTWGSHLSQRESAEIARQADEYLGQLDGLFGLLVAHPGEFRVTGQSISFQDPKTAQTYGDLRGWLLQHSGDAGDSVAVPLRFMRRAVAGAQLPALGQ